MAGTGELPKSGGDAVLSSDINNLAYAVMKDWKGDGSDGSYTCSGAQTLNLNQEYNLTDLTVNSGCTLSFTGYGPALLRISGNCTINGTINLKGNGYPGGAGGGAAAAGKAGIGFAWKAYANPAYPGAGGENGTPGAGPAGGGASIINDGTDGTGAGHGDGGTSLNDFMRAKYGFYNLSMIGLAGMGTGGGGGAGGAGTGDQGGAGGGCLVLMVGGSLTFSDYSEINLTGSMTASGGNGGYGGGGGGGYAIIFHKGPLSDGGVTVNCSGATGFDTAGDGGNGTYDIQRINLSE